MVWAEVTPAKESHDFLCTVIIWDQAHNAFYFLKEKVKNPDNFNTKKTLLHLKSWRPLPAHSSVETKRDRKAILYSFHANK